MKKLRIVHYCPNLEPSGVGRLAIDLASALQAAGHDNYIISPSHELLARLNLIGIKHIPLYKGSIWKTPYRIRRSRLLFKDKPVDIFQSYHIEHALRTFLPYLFSLKKQNTKLVAVHQSFLARHQYSRSLRYFSAATACSQGLREYVQSCEAVNPLAPFWHIPYGVREHECRPSYHPSEDWIRLWQHNQPQTLDTFLLAIPCNITPIHGLEDLPLIIRGLKARGIPVHVLIIGDTRDADQSYLTSLRQQFLSNGVTDNISWLGARPDLRDLLCISNATLSLARLPASYNQAILEALSLGRPVAGYDHGIVSEMLQSFLPEGRIALGDTVSIVNLLAQWFKKAPESIKEAPYPYRLKDTVQNYLQLYEQIISN